VNTLETESRVSESISNHEKKERTTFTSERNFGCSQKGLADKYLIKISAQFKSA
jgi:hypothetical protein